jgi:hypothetical protein
MAPGSNNSNVITKEWRDPYGPTGHLGYVQTADGQVWEVVEHLPYRGTGDRQGTIVNGRVRE